MSTISFSLIPDLKVILSSRFKSSINLLSLLFLGDFPITVRRVRGYSLNTLGKAKIRCLKPFKGISELAVVTILKSKVLLSDDGLKFSISMPFGITVILSSLTLNSAMTSSFED